jgi:hypothetical protein
VSPSVAKNKPTYCATKQALHEFARMAKSPEQDREDRVTLARYRTLIEETTDPLATLLLRDIVEELEHRIDNEPAPRDPPAQEDPSPGNLVTRLSGQTRGSHE